MSYDNNQNENDHATIKALKENELLLAEKSGNRVDISNTYISEIIHEKQLKAEKDKEEDFRNILNNQLRLLNDLGDIFSQIDSKLDEFKSSRNRQERMAKAELDGDYDTLSLIFISEYGMNADEVNGMSHEDLREQRIRFDHLEQQNQSVIVAEISDLADQYKQRAEELGETRPDLAAHELEKLNKIKYKAAAMGLDFEKIFDNSLQNGNSDFHLATNKHERSDIGSTLNNQFNKVAPIEQNGKSLFADNSALVKQDRPNLFN